MAAGVVRGETQNAADAMGGRIVIPIGDEKGKTIGELVRNRPVGSPDYVHQLTVPLVSFQNASIAFGGRKMSEAEGGPKYLNTKETILFRKGETLFAEHLLPPPQAPATALIVEGYFDVVTYVRAAETLPENGVSSPLGRSLRKKWGSKNLFCPSGCTSTASSGGSPASGPV